MVCRLLLPNVSAIFARMDRHPEPPPESSPQLLDRWPTIWLYAGVALLVARLYFSSSSGIAPVGKSTDGECARRAFVTGPTVMVYAFRWTKAARLGKVL